MDNWQLLIGANAFLMAILGYFVRSWIAKTEKKIEAKLDSMTCNERHGLTMEKCRDLFRHKHAPILADGRGGEVIVP